MRTRDQIWILAALLALSGPAASVAAPSTQAVIAEVQTALDRGDAKAAATLAEGGLKERDLSAIERARLQFYHGLAEELLGASEAATRDLTAALTGSALPPGERAQALLQRGFLYDGQGKLAEAAADYSGVIALKGEGLANALNNRANVYRRQSNFTDARRDYQAALAAKGKAQYSWYGLGQIAEAEGDILSARGFYAKAVAADSAYAPAVARLSALGGPPDGAIADPKAPITLKPPAAAPSAPAASLPPQFTPAPPGQVASAAPADAPIVLRPPQPKAQAPAKPPAPARTAETPGPGITLRPSMDQSAAAGGQVQLGAWRSEAEARDGWQKAQAQARDLLGGLQPRVVAADIPGKGRYYRLRVSPGPGVSRAQLCEGLTAEGIACFAVRD